MSPYVCSAETGVMGKAIPLLSVARLLDAAILYGSDNATLVGQLIAQVPFCASCLKLHRVLLA